VEIIDDYQRLAVLLDYGLNLPTALRLISGVRWDDLKFPMSGQGLDTTSGRHGINYYNGVVFFNSNARYTSNAVNEVVSMNCQLPHEWQEGSGIRPHIHWLQQHATNIPNWLLGYIIKPKGQIVTLETDFTNMTFLTIQSNAFTYTSGVLEQISGFGEISMTGYTLSDNIHFCLWRDAANDSTEFSGVDPSSLTEYIREFDVHYQSDGDGSRQEYTK